MPRGYRSVWPPSKKPWGIRTSPPPPGASARGSIRREECWPGWKRGKRVGLEFASEAPRRKTDGQQGSDSASWPTGEKRQNCPDAGRSGRALVRFIEECFRRRRNHRPGERPPVTRSVANACSGLMVFPFRQQPLADPTQDRSVRIRRDGTGSGQDRPVQNSTPWAALIPWSKACLILVISETVSAASTTSCGASRPVRIRCSQRGLSCVMKSAISRPAIQP